MWSSLRARLFAAFAPLLALLAGCDGSKLSESQRFFAGDPEAGRGVIAAVECGVCHVIPGVPGAHGVVGPPLNQFARRKLVAGFAPNEPTVLTQWVRAAPSMAPGTAMPNLPLTVEQARDVAAYLYTLR